MFGDNESQINSTTVPYARLNKRHNILLYHYCRSLIAKGFVALSHLCSRQNPADTLSKHWSHQSNYKYLIKPMLNRYDYVNTIDIEDLASLPEGYEIVRSA